MSKNKLLMKVIEDMGSLAMSLEAVVVAMALEEQGVEEKVPLIWETDDEEQKEIKKEKVKEVEKEKEKEKVEPKKQEVKNKVKLREAEENKVVESKAIKEVSLEEVRAVLAEKSQAGFTAEVKDLIRSYGCNKLSQVKKVYYSSLMEIARDLSKEGSDE